MMSYYMFNVSIAIELIRLCSSILDYMTSHHNTLSDITSQCTVLHCNNVLNGITLYYTVLHGIYMVLHGITLRYIVVHCVSLCYLVLYYVLLHCITAYHIV